MSKTNRFFGLTCLLSGIILTSPQLVSASELTCTNLGRPERGITIDLLEMSSGRYHDNDEIVEYSSNSVKNSTNVSQSVSFGDMSISLESDIAGSICVSHGGGPDKYCGIPISCSDQENRFVLFDDDGQIAFELNIPADIVIRDPEEIRQEWLANRRIVFEHNISKEGLADREAISAESLKPGCELRTNVPFYDPTAYLWIGTCQPNGYATGSGTLVMLLHNGGIGVLRIHVDSGLALADGEFFWSFPNPNMVVRLECLDENDELADSRAEVDKTRFHVTVHRRLNIQEFSVFSEIQNSLEFAAIEHCGVDFYEHDASFTIAHTLPHDGVIRGSIQSGIRDRSIYYAFNSDPYNLHSSSSAAEKENEIRHNYRHFFVEYLTNKIVGGSIDQIIENSRNRRLSTNPADYFQFDELLGINIAREGIDFTIPLSDLRYTNGSVISNWRFEPQNFVEQYFANLTGDLWDQFEIEVQRNISRTPLQLSCVFDPDDIHVDRSTTPIRVSAELIDYVNHTASFRCQEIR